MAETKNHGGDNDHCIHKVHGTDRQKETCTMVETSTTVETKSKDCGRNKDMVNTWRDTDHGRHRS